MSSEKPSSGKGLSVLSVYVEFDDVFGPLVREFAVVKGFVFEAGDLLDQGFGFGLLLGIGGLRAGAMKVIDNTSLTRLNMSGDSGRGVASLASGILTRMTGQRR